MLTNLGNICEHLVYRASWVEIFGGVTSVDPLIRKLKSSYAPKHKHAKICTIYLFTVLIARGEGGKPPIQATHPLPKLRPQR